MVYVTFGLRYRFRVVGAASDICPITIAVDDHPLTVIAVDGMPIKPVVVDRITVMSGERYDFVLEADQEVNSYWIRAAGGLTCQQYQVR